MSRFLNFLIAILVGVVIFVHMTGDKEQDYERVLRDMENNAEKHK